MNGTLLAERNGLYSGESKNGEKETGKELQGQLGKPREGRSGCTFTPGMGDRKNFGSLRCVLVYCDGRWTIELKLNRT